MLIPFLLKSKKYIIVDSNSFKIINSEQHFDTLNFFKDGFCLASIENDFFYINKELVKFRPPMDYTNLTDFTNGLAIVENSDIFYCINRSFLPIHKYWFSMMKFRNDGLIDIATGYSSWNTDFDIKYGIMDKTGFIVIEPSQKYELKFYKDIAIIQDKGRYKLVNKQGEIFGNFLLINDFNDDLTGATSNDGKHCIINLNGEIIKYIDYDEVGSFNDGFCQVKKDGLHSFCNADGELISNYFANVYPFSNGFAIVSKIVYLKSTFNLEEYNSFPRKYSFINKDGKLQSEFSYNTPTDIYDYILKLIHPNIAKLNCCEIFDMPLNGYFKIRIGDYDDHNLFIGQYGLVNNKGEKICPTIYEYCDVFNEKYFQVKKNRKIGIIDLNGSLILSCKYDEIIDEVNNFFYVRINDRKFIASKEYDEISEFEFTVKKDKVIPPLF